MKFGRWLACISLAAAVAAALAGCGGPAETTTTPTPTTSVPTVTFSAAAPTITTQDAYAFVQKNANNPGFVVLDVRTPEEFAAGHILGAVNLDYNTKTFREDVTRLDTGKEYVLYCKTGPRSSGAAMIMEGLGFENIVWMTGGIVQWQADGYPVETP